MSDGYGGQQDPADLGWNPPGGQYPQPNQPSQYPAPGQTPQPGQYPPPGQYQPPGQQPPAAQYPQQQSYPPAAAMPEKKSRRGCLWALLLVPLLLVLGVGGCSAAVFFAVREPIDATNLYVAHLDNGDYASAYDSLCRAALATSTLEEFTAAQIDQFGDDITAYSFTTAEVEGIGSERTATVSGTIEIGGLNTNRTFRLVEEDGNWKICR